MAIGFGIIGCGMIANFHAKAIADIRGAKLVGCFDTFPSAADRLAASTGCQAYHDLKQMLRDPSIDVVTIGTPSGAHMEPALADALGISVEDLQALKEDDFNLKDYADEQGWTDEELAEIVKGAFTNAINAALEDGTITQEQADRLLDRLENSPNGRLPFGRPPHGRGGN